MQNLIRKIALIITFALNLNLSICSTEQVNSNGQINDKQTVIEITTLQTQDHTNQLNVNNYRVPQTTDEGGRDSSKVLQHHHAETPNTAPEISPSNKQKVGPNQLLPKPIHPQPRTYRKPPQIEPPSTPDSSPRLQRSNTHTPYQMNRRLLNMQTAAGNEFYANNSMRNRSESYGGMEVSRRKKPSVGNIDSPLIKCKKTLPVSEYNFQPRRSSKNVQNDATDWFTNTPNISSPFLTSTQITHKKTIQPSDLGFRSRTGSRQLNIRNNKNTIQTTCDEELYENTPKALRKSSLLNNYPSILADVSPTARKEALSTFINSLPLLQHLENMIKAEEEAERRLEEINSKVQTAQTIATANSTSVATSSQFRSPRPSCATYRPAQPSQRETPKGLSRDKEKEIYAKCLNALIEGAVSNPLVYNVLSIDGGGIRGIVACTILDNIEISTGYRIQELFNVFTGTSIGGIIAIALMLRDAKGNFLYHPYQIRQILEKNASRIFYRPWYAKFSRAFRSKYENKNLELLLKALIQGNKKDKHLKIELDKAKIDTTFKTHNEVRISLSSSNSYVSEPDTCLPHVKTPQRTPSDSDKEEHLIIEEDILDKENVITSLHDIAMIKPSNYPAPHGSKINPNDEPDSPVDMNENSDDKNGGYTTDETNASYASDLEEALPQEKSQFLTVKSKMRLIVPAYDIHGLNTVIFDSDGDKNYSLIDVALSTSAAPTYFPSHPTHEKNKEDNTLNNVDGGLFSNFPAPAAISRLIGHNRLKPQLNVVSASTGSAPKASEDNLQKDRGRLSWLLHGLFSIIRRSPTQFAEDTLDNCADTYIRFRIPLKHASSSMDKSTKKNIQNLIHDAKTYCKENESLFMDVKRKIVPLAIIDSREVEPLTYAVPDAKLQQHLDPVTRANSYNGLSTTNPIPLYPSSTPQTEYYIDDEYYDSSALYGEDVYSELGSNDSKSRTVCNSPQLETTEECEETSDDV